MKPVSWRAVLGALTAAGIVSAVWLGLPELGSPRGSDALNPETDNDPEAHDESEGRKTEVRCYVVDERGRRAPHATIVLESRGRKMRSVADANGVSRFRDVRAGARCTLRVADARFLGAGPVLHVAGESPATLSVQRAGSLRVRVVDGSRAPIEGAHVRLRRVAATPGTEPAAVTDTTGPDGSVLIGPVPLGRYVVRAADGELAATRDAEVRFVTDPASVSMQLVPAPRLEGTVVGPEDRPVDGATVLAVADGALGEAADWAARVACRTDADGAYVLTGLRPGRNRVLVRRGHHVETTTVVRVPDVSRLDIRVGALGRVEGVVRRADSGEPIPAVEVRAEGARHASRTGADGRFTLAVPPGLPPRLRFSGADVAPLGPLTVGTAVEAGGTVSVDVEMHRGAAIRGSVWSGRRRVGEARLDLDLETAGGAHLKRTALCDPQGEFVLEHVPPGTARLTVRVPGGLAIEPEGGTGASPTADARLTLPSTGELLLRLELPPGSPLTVRVTDEDGEPVPNAGVRVTSPSGVSEHDLDATGSFRLEHVPDHLAVRIEAFEGARVGEVVHTGGGTSPDLVLREPSLLRGRLVGDRRAADPCTVRVMRATPEQRPWVLDQSWQRAIQLPVSAGGQFEAALPADWDAALIRAESRTAVSGTKRIDLPSRTPRVAETDLAMGPRARLIGSVTLDGQPLADARVRMLPWTEDLDPTRALVRAWLRRSPVVAITDAEGRFTVIATRTGPYAVEVTSPTCVPARFRADIPRGQPVEVRLEHELVTEGRVAFADGQPVIGAVVEARPADRGRRLWTRSTSDGRFRLDGLPPGSCRIDVRPGAGKGCSSLLAARFDGVVVGSRGLELRVEPGEALRVRVLGPSGAGVYSHVVAEGPAGRIAAYSDEYGRCVLRGLGAAELRVRAEPAFSGHVSHLLPVTVSASPGGETVTLRLELGRTISGSLHDPTGVPVSAAKLIAENVRDADDVVQAETDSKGAFVIRPLRKGRYRLSLVADATSATWLDPNGSVEAGSTDLRLLARPGVSISGDLVDGEGKPLAEADVWVRSGDEASGHQRATRTDSEGRFDIRGLRPNTVYELWGRLGSAAPVRLARTHSGSAGLRVRLD